VVALLFAAYDHSDASTDQHKVSELYTQTQSYSIVMSTQPPIRSETDVVVVSLLSTTTAMLVQIRTRRVDTEEALVYCIWRTDKRT